MNIGLFFGSFNPIHVGHLIIANYVATHTLVDQVWLVVSPHNPLKKEESLLNEYHRLHLVTLAVGDNSKIKASNIEFSLPKPSYTVDTLTYLNEKYPKHQFSIVIGSDSYRNIHRWKNYEVLLRNYKIYVYIRPGFEIDQLSGNNIEILKAPLLDISATYVRKLLKDKRSVQYLIPDNARFEIEQNNYYV